MNRSILAGVVFVCCLFSFSMAHASGVSGYISDNQRQKIDPNYEEGKSIYQGRAPGAKKLAIA